MRVPADASYITGTSVAVTVSASKTGFTAPSDVTRTLTVDLAAPTAPAYTAPASLKVGVAVTVTPSGGAGIDAYSATGLPSGLSIDPGTGVIGGTPDTHTGSTQAATVTVTDAAGNSATAAVTFPAVGKGDQTLAGFSYSAMSVTFGSAAPTVTAPTGAVTAVTYSATPAAVCTVNASTGALTLVGVGECVITATAASDADYNEATAEFTVTVQAAGALVLNVDAIAGNDTVNIAEKAAGFTIGGDTGSEGEVTVAVTVGTEELTATSDNSGAWSVSVPADASYITGTSVTVTVSASKTGFTSPSDVTRTLTVDLAAPTAPAYTAPASLKVGVAVTMTPSGGAGIDAYGATGLPSGLSIDPGTGVIGGTPDTHTGSTQAATVTVTDAAGNSATAAVTFPAVGKGDQTLAGFIYSAMSVTFGSAAPGLTAPTGAVTAVTYSATPAAVCTVNASTGALTLAGVGECVITATAASDADYNEATAEFTVTVQAAGALVLNVDAIAGNDTVNIAEKAAGFTIGGDTGSEGGVAVTVTVGTTSLTATSDNSGAWSVSVPADASYITGTSVAVTVSASKTGFTSPSDVTRTLTVDLTAPTAPSYTAPASLKVGVAVTVTPSGGAGIAAYGATGLPSGLSIDPGTGVIGGTPDTHTGSTQDVTVTVTDAAGNSATAAVTFPAVAKGDQTLAGFIYSAMSVTFGSAAPGLTAPTGAVTAVTYSATPAAVCTVNASTGALTLAGVGECVITATAASDADYNEATAEFTVTVQAAGALVLNVDAIAGNDTVNIAEKAAGFTIGGDTGSEGGVAVAVTVGTEELTATSASDGAWSVSVPADASYITGTSVTVTVSASKTGFTAPSDVTRTLTVDLAAPTAPAYTAPASLKARRGDGEVHLEWVPVAAVPTDPDLAYQLRYGAEGGESNQWRDIPGSAPGGPNARSYTVTGLENGTRYAFELRVRRESGFGTAAEIRQTPEAPRWSVSTNRRSVHEGEDVTLSIATRNAVGFYSAPEALTLAVMGQIVLEFATIKGADPEDFEIWVDGHKVQGYTKDITLLNFDIDLDRDPFPAQHFDVEVPVGSTSLDVTVTVLADDEEEEGQEHMTFMVFRGEELVNEDTWDGTGVNIESRDAGVVKQLAVADAEATEGEDPSLDFVVTLAPAAAWTVTVDYATRDGTARAGSDYTDTSGALTFAPGETEKTVSVPVIDDTVEDTPETLTLRLSNADPEYTGDSGVWGSEEAGVLIANSVATGTIRNTEDQAEPRAVSVSDASAAEGDSVVFTVSLSATSSQQVTVDYATSDGTATAGEDYTVTSGTLTFQAGETTKTISVPITDDTEDDGGETFTLTLSNASGADLGDAEATGTIRDTKTAVDLSADFPESAFTSKRHTGSDDRPQVVVAFSEAVAEFAANTPSVSVTGASGLSVQTHTEDGLENAYVFFMTPDGDGDVTFALTTNAACAAGGICTAGGTVLTEVPATLTIPGPEAAADDDTDADDTAPASLTAAFGEVPAEHDGQSAFNVRVQFSEDVGISYVTLRDESFSVTDGDVTGARRVDGRHDLWEITVEPDSREAVTISLPGGSACGTAGAVCTRGDDPRPLSNSPSATVAGPADDAPEPNTAAAGAPTISGTPQVGEALTVSTSGISDADGLDNAHFAYQWIRTGADIQGATGSTYTPVAADQGQRLKVRVRFTDDAGHEERLTSAATDAVAAPPAPAPLTARFSDVPTEHTGEAFTFGLTFSEDVAGLSFKTLRDQAFTVTGGAVRKAQRRQQGSNEGWTITVDPDSHAAVTIRLPAGAVETSDGRGLESAVSATVAGPVGISVVDARVEEGAGAMLEFAVTLSRAAAGQVTVDYQTVNGTASAGSDYTAANGTLTFEAGESSKTVEVAVLDDSHDEGEETMTLRLSNPSEGRLADAEATGTIENTDPLPRALLARFGRATALHVMEQVEERLEASRASGFRGRFAGRELRRGMERDMGRNFLSRLQSTAVQGARDTTGVQSDLSGSELLRTGLGGGDVLMGSGFVLNRETGGGASVSLWSRGMESRFSGRDGDGRHLHQGGQPGTAEQQSIGDGRRAPGSR